MSSASKSKSKDKRNVKEQKASSKAPGTLNGTSGISAAYNPILGTFHTFETPSASSIPTLHVIGRFRNIDETDDHSGSTNGSGCDYDSASNNDTQSMESEEHKEKVSNVPLRHEVVPGADNDKREKIRQKNERKHQRQKERRAQELHERCRGYLMSRKLEALAQQLVAMGFSSERATMALISNEGKMEEAVAWLFEGGENVDKHKDHSIDRGCNLKIDISEELARITEMENRFKCSRQEVARAVVACEGDLEKAEETLKVQKQETSSGQQKTEESGDPPSVCNGNITVSINQSSVRLQTKQSTTPLIQQRRDEKDFNFTKAATTVGSVAKTTSNNVQQLTRIQPKLECVNAKPQQMAVPAEKRWPAGGSSPSVSYSLASTLQVLPPSSKTESCYAPGAGEYKNLQAAPVREPVVMMQCPQSVSAKQVAVTTASSSPPGISAGWYPVPEVMKPNGSLPQIPCTRNFLPNNLSSKQFYHQMQYQQQQHMMGSSTLDTSGASRGNPSWSKMGTSPTLAAAASLGLFSGLGSSCSSGSTSPVDWNTGGSMPSCDYTNVDWSLDRSFLNPRISNGLWRGLGSHTQKNPLVYDPNASSMGLKSAMRPSNLNGISIAGLQDGGKAVTDASASSSREWTSPFEGKDLFSFSRFVSSPSL